MNINNFVLHCSARDLIEVLVDSDYFCPSDGINHRGDLYKITSSKVELACSDPLQLIIVFSGEKSEIRQKKPTDAQFTEEAIRVEIIDEFLEEKMVKAFTRFGNALTGGAKFSEAVSVRRTRVKTRCAGAGFGIYLASLVESLQSLSAKIIIRNTNRFIKYRPAIKQIIQNKVRNKPPGFTIFGVNPDELAVRELETILFDTKQKPEQREIESESGDTSTVANETGALQDLIAHLEQGVERTEARRKMALTESGLKTRTKRLRELWGMTKNSKWSDYVKEAQKRRGDWGV